MHESSSNTPKAQLTRLRADHLDAILALMNREGWYYYDRHELERYLALKQACFVAVEEGHVAGSLFTTDYGNQAWIGNIVVAATSRGRGLASGLIREAVAHLRGSRGITTFRLGAVPLAIGLYKKAGFHAEAFTTAQEAELPLRLEPERIDLGTHARIGKIAKSDLAAIGEIDRRFFKSDRLELLTTLYEDSLEDARVCLKDRDRLVGFLMIRRRQASKIGGHFAEGPDYAYRLGPCCVLPEYGIDGFKALFQAAIGAVNAEVDRLGGSARMYVVFPRNADKADIHADTRALAAAMGMEAGLDLDAVFDEHARIFGAPRSAKCDAQWRYMAGLGFHQEYFEQVMSYTPGEATDTPPALRHAEATRADPEGVFATATPGDKA